MTSSSTCYSNISFSLHIQHLSKKQAYPAKNRSCTIVQNIKRLLMFNKKVEKYNIFCLRITKSKGYNCSTGKAKMLQIFNLW